MPADVASNVGRVMELADPSRWRNIPYDLPPTPNRVDVEPNSARESIDCSLYVLAVFSQAGILLQGRTAEQIRQAIGNVVAWGDVKPGDLLFFERTYQTPDRATHIGISHGAGSGKMYDAHDRSNSNSAVGLTDISVGYWQDRIFEARRPKSLVESGPGPGPVPPSPGTPAGESTLDNLHRIRWEGMGIGYNPLTGICAFWKEHPELGAAVSPEVTLEDGRAAQAFAGGVVVSGPNGPRIL